MKRFTKKKTLQHIIILTFVFKMRHHTTKSRLAGSQLVLRGGIENLEEMWVNEHYQVHRHLMCHSRGFREQFPAFFYFNDPIPACFPFKSNNGRYFKYMIQLKKNVTCLNFIKLSLSPHLEFFLHYLSVVCQGYHGLIKKFSTCLQQNSFGPSMKLQTSFIDWTRGEHNITQP